ncbi:poly(ADP-ribose) glycohydrolase-like isoform X2 [Dermacentor variabilis]|uniref:poly(ADP-ribose) glycohydrolase-like isoform X2 n=1 Tax=Dermacentor variabilis TaxID=34621 RepID=UPI003F5CA17F
MSDGVGPSKKRFKQVDLQWFLATMLEKHSSNEARTNAQKHSSSENTLQFSDVQVSAQPAESSPGVATKFGSDDLEEINSSQELFPELDAANSQVPKCPSDSEETVVDSSDAPCQSAEHSEASLYCSETQSPDDKTIPDSCEGMSSSQQSSGSEESIPCYSTIPETFRRTPHCGIQCPQMSRNHTVLCKSNGATTLRSRWELIENSLLGPITDSHSLVKAIRQYNGRVSANWNFKCLHKFFGQELDSRESKSFFQVLLPKIVALALRLPALVTQPIPLLKSSQDQVLSMSQLQAGCLLANAFFCTFPRRNTLKSNSEYSNYPDINFNRLFSGTSDEARKMEKLKCIVNYFRRITKEEPTGMLTFHRRCLTEPYEWSSAKNKLGNLFVSESGFIEREGQGMLQVDFANKFIGGGVLGGGCVQEEIRFMMCPELIVSRLFTEALGSREVLVITGAEQFNATSGYAGKFTWENDFKDEVPRDPWERRCTEIVAMDALCFVKPQEQYRLNNIRRELNKAYCGFICRPEIPLMKRSAIATGNWGCGAFRGDPQLKAIIQLMAASVAGRDLVYFTFGDKQLCQRLRALYRLLTNCNLSVDDLYKLLAQYSQHQSTQASQGKFHLFEYLSQNCTP